jgi:hypothetical protein
MIEGLPDAAKRTNFVVVLAARDAGAVGGRTNLDQQDRRRGERRNFEHRPFSRAATSARMDFDGWCR